MAPRRPHRALRTALLALAILLAASGLAAAASAGREAPRKPSGDRRPGAEVPIGIKARLSDRDDAELAAVVSKLRATGVSIVREDVAWSTIEPRPGRYFWDGMDRWVAAAAGQGLEVMAMVGAPPSWATPSWNVAPSGGEPLSDFSEFVREVVARYGAGGAFWQAHPGLQPVPIRYWDIWNEPYASRFWGGESPDPAAYAQMFKAVVQAARGADPAARFMLEADTRIVSDGWPWKPFLAAMFDAVPDLGRYAYGVSVHPYQGDGGSPRSCTPATRSPGSRARWQATALQFCRLTDIHQILAAHGAGDLKIWITEVGWSTAPAAPGAVSDAAQADYVRQTFELLRTRYRGLVSGLIWYEYEGPEADPSELDEYLGLVRSDGQPKPAWRAFAEALDDEPQPRRSRLRS
jgi:hypothetical protein